MDTTTAIETAETMTSRKLDTKRSAAHCDRKPGARKAFNRADRKAGKAVCRAALRSY